MAFPLESESVKKSGKGGGLGLGAPLGTKRGRGLVDIFRQFVQDKFLLSDDIGAPFFKGAQARHKNPPRVISGVRLGIQSNFSRNSGGPEISWGQVILCGNPSASDPVI